MIAAAIVCAAAFAQAAQVSWGGAFANVDCTDTLPTGTQAWLVYSATAFSGTATQADSSLLAARSTTVVQSLTAMR